MPAFLSHFPCCVYSGFLHTGELRRKFPAALESSLLEKQSRAQFQIIKKSRALRCFSWINIISQLESDHAKEININLMEKFIIKSRTTTVNKIIYEAAGCGNLYR